MELALQVVWGGGCKAGHQHSSVGNCKILQKITNLGQNRVTYPITGLATFTQQWQAGLEIK